MSSSSVGHSWLAVDKSQTFHFKRWKERERSYIFNLWQWISDQWRHISVSCVNITSLGGSTHPGHTYMYSASINQNFNTEFLLVPGSYYLYLLSCCCWKSCIFSLVFSSNLSFCKEKLNTGNIVLVQELCSLHAADNSYLNCSTSCSTRVDSDVKLE